MGRRYGDTTCTRKLTRASDTTQFFIRAEEKHKGVTNDLLYWPAVEVRVCQR